MIKIGIFINLYFSIAGNQLLIFSAISHSFYITLTHLVICNAKDQPLPIDQFMSESDSNILLPSSSKSILNTTNNTVVNEITQHKVIVCPILRHTK